MTLATATPTLHRSALELDVTHPAIVAAIADVHFMHRLVMSGWAGYTETRDFFTGQQTGHPDHRASLGILYAVSTPRPGGKLIIITQAHQPADWNLAATADTGRLPWTDALCRPPSHNERVIENSGATIDFELRGIPSKKNGPRREAATSDHTATTWLNRRLQAAGLQVIGHPPAASHPVNLESAVKTERTRHQQHAGGRFLLKSLRWQGTATIVDHAAYTDAVANGIGPGKPYGAGLLLTRPAR